ncbi:acyltransferase family protein [Bradyrhizobium diazoefficiens]|uniref:acyltransferase family protein n=1 Tax=Bradyrhizobium diazoefficiens TaxID=1355477 RepID=UPI003834D4F8
MIANLQLLRAAAALGVVFYHTDFRLPGGPHTDFNGVAIFFVISGFIMSHVTQSGEQQFLLKRLIRIAPLYWIATFIMLLTNHRLRIIWPSFWLKGEPPLFLDTARSLLFLPWENLPVLGVGWTLNLEMYFYLVFSVMLAISRRWSPVLTALFVLAVIAADYLTSGRHFLLHFYAHPYIWNFFHGIAIYYLWSFAGRLVAPPAAITYAALIVAWSWACFLYPTWPLWLAGGVWIAPPLVVGSALFLERTGLSAKWRPILLLGDASYSIYLVHTIWFEQLRPYLRDLGLAIAKDSLAIMTFSVISAALVGIAMHLWIERPLLARLRSQFLLRKSDAIASKAVAAQL